MWQIPFLHFFVVLQWHAKAPWPTLTRLPFPLCFHLLPIIASLTQDLDAPHLEGVCTHCKVGRIEQGHRLLQVSTCLPPYLCVVFLYVCLFVLLPVYLFVCVEQGHRLLQKSNCVLLHRCVVYHIVFVCFLPVYLFAYFFVFFLLCGA